MNHRARIMTIAAGCATALCLSVVPASADTRVVHDRRGDAAPGYDLTRTAFHNAPHRVAVKVHVVGLQHERARFSLAFGPVSNPDLAFVARTTLAPDGSVDTPDNLYISREGPPLRIKCSVRAAWRPAVANTVTISVPQSCLRDDAGRLGMRAIIVKPGTSVADQTGWFKLARG